MALKQKALGRQVDDLLGRVRRGDSTAIAPLQQLGERAPKHPQVLNALGCLALEQGDGEQALSYLRRAQRRGYLNQREQQRNRLIAHAMIGDLDGFEREWAAISAQHDGREREIALLKSALKAARVKQQAPLIERCLALWQARAPEDPALALSRINLLLHQGEREAARQALPELPPIPARDLDNLIGAAGLCHRLKHPTALHYFNKAVEAEPSDANALQRLISLGGNLKQFATTLELLERLLERYPELAESKLYDRLNLYQQANRWDEVERLVPEYLAAVRAGRISPKGLFRHLSLPGLSDADHLLLANAYLAAKPPVREPPPASVFERPPRAGRRLRIGYLSADFKQHPVAQLLVEVLEQHDRARFALIGYDLAEPQTSYWRSRILAAFDEVVPARTLSDAELIERVRADAIDLLIDLQGDTTDSRVWLLRHRLAPIQVGWLGFPGGLGDGLNDYLLADRHVIPETAFPDFAEQPVWLPDTYIPNDPQRQPLEKPPRLALGLPEEAIVFCCFNGQYKITRELFHAWCRILAQVEDSVLWLRKEDPSVIAHLRATAEAEGIDPERLHFAPRTATQVDHLTRLQCADIALDTRPYNGHTTTIDALWARLPVITLPGASFASRVAASILQVAGHPDWIARDLDDYIAKAVALANDPARLAAAKHALQAARAHSPLYDSARFVRGLEQAFEAMYARFEQGLAPAPILDLDLDRTAPAPAPAPGRAALDTDAPDPAERDIDTLDPDAPEVNAPAADPPSTRRPTDEQAHGGPPTGTPPRALSVALMLENAHSLLYKEQLAPAQALFEQVLAAEPEQPAACHGLGLIHGLRGDYDQALVYLDQALAGDPDNARYQGHRETLLRKQRDNHHARLTETLNEAQALHQAGDLAAAGERYEAILAQSPRHPRALHYKGLVEVQQGQASGLEKMRHAIAIQPHSKEFLHNYRQAEALLQRQRPTAERRPLSEPPPSAPDPPEEP